MVSARLRPRVFGRAKWSANLEILGFKLQRFPCMNLYRYTLRTGWNQFGGQRNMARFEENMDDFEGKFALTGRALPWQPVAMLCCKWPVVSLLPNPDPFRTEL
jgi:hypothetical protein